jgi:dolichol-phosphate mannosyltransferase
VVVVRLAKNQGVGGATLAGYAEAARRGGRVMVKVDGDDQMDLGYIGHLVAPILLGEADYAKGNRFTSISHLTTMPQVRVFGNAALSFAAKLSTGYWNIFDPTNGYTAIEANVARLVMEKRVSRRFFFETDLLYHLGTLRAVVRDVPMPARYADEVSNIRISQVIGPFAFRHARNFAQRVVGQYFVRDFSAASLELVFGLFFLLFGIGYAMSYLANRIPGQAASAGVVMLAALPVILGVQFLLQAMNFDVLNVPSRPIHPYLNVLRTLETEE